MLLTSSSKAWMLSRIRIPFSGPAEVGGAGAQLTELAGGGHQVDSKLVASQPARRGQAS